MRKTNISPMSGSEIAKELGITRQAVSNTLKRTLGKLISAVKKDHPEWDYFDSAVSIMTFLDVEEDDMSKFFRLFPPKSREKIERDARKRMGGMKG